MKSAMNWITAAAVTSATIYLVVVIALYALQRKMLYLPDTAVHAPAEFGLSSVDTVVMPTPDGENLTGWYLPAKPGQPTILFFHGNAGSIAGRADRMMFYRKQGFGALFVSYRGYGGSSGTPTEEGLINDALASYDWLIKKKVASGNIIAVGESLGAGVAAQLATRRTIAAMIMEAPFTSAIDVAKSRYWWVPVDLLMKDRFETVNIIGELNIPILIIHGENDEITNVEQGKTLFAKANQPKILKIIENASHNGIMVEETWQLEKLFLKSLTAPATAPNPS